jgi:hypothetical protein
LWSEKPSGVTVLKHEYAVLICVSDSHVSTRHGASLTEAQREIAAGSRRDAKCRIVVSSLPEESDVPVVIESCVAVKLSAVKRDPAQVIVALCDRKG